MVQETYEILWVMNHVDVREMADGVGFVMPFLVGTPGEARVLGVFPERMGRGFARQFEKGMTSLGLANSVSFYTTSVPRIFDRDFVYVIEKDGRPLGLSLGKVALTTYGARAHRCEVGRVYYEGLGN